MSRVALRAEFEDGLLDKHEYARRMALEHQALTDYQALLAAGEIASITIDARGVILESRLADARFVCDPQDRGIPPIVALNFGSYEAKDFAMVMALVAGAKTVVDAGANIGWYAVHIAKRLPSARVIAFEPVPSSYAWLRANVELNRLTNVTAVNAGLWNEAGEQVLFVDPTIAGAASIAPSAMVETQQRARCPVLRLDDYVAEHGLTVDFLKADVEGAELRVLEGALATVERDHPAICTEMLRKHAKPFGYHPNDILALLAAHGYACYRAEDGRLIPFERMDEETVETNFFFLHRDRHAETIAQLARASG